MEEALTAELERALLGELRRTWHELNGRHFRDALRAPVLRLIDARQTLGRWEPDTRSIALSRPLLCESRWGAVVEVLKHEMAHQYVHEVLGVRDESAHGPAFRSVCEQRAIDAAACGVPPAGEEPAASERSRVLERIARLLALAESPNRHEAETAAAVAQRLMLKHNIAEAERGAERRYGYRHLGEPKGRVPEAEHLLAAILAEYYFVEAIWVGAFRAADGKRGSVLEICGTPENLELACYVHAFLLGTAARLWSEHKRELGLDGNRERRSFVAGVMEGFRERLRTERRKNGEQGLVWVGDADLGRYHRRRHPHIRTVRLQGHGGSEARSRGREAGRGIVLRRGVGEGTSGQVRALPGKRS